MDVVSQINKAVELVKNKDYKSAEEIYVKVLELNPDNHIVLSFLGFLYITTKDYSKAENFFEKAYGLSQDNTIISGLALSKFLLQKFEDCIPFYVNLIKNDEKCDYYEKITLALCSIISTGKKEYLKMAYDYSYAGTETTINKVLYDTDTIDYRLRSTNKVLNCENKCVYDTQRVYDKYVRSYVSGSTTYSCPSGYSLEGTNCVKRETKYTYEPIYETVTTTVPVEVKKPVEKTRQIPIKENVKYYRYRTREQLTVAGTYYKWSRSKNDKNLLDQGYYLTGNKREV